MAYVEGNKNMVVDQATQTIDIPKEFTDSVIRELFLRGVINAPVKRKPRMNWENLYAREFVGTYFPNDMSWYRHEVGPIPPGRDPKLFKRVRRWADAIVYKITDVIIMEFKMRPEIKAISQLYSYLDLFSSTPEFSNIKHLPKQGWIVTTMEDAPTMKLAHEWGLEYVIFKPSFYDDWAKTHILMEKYEEESKA